MSGCPHAVNSKHKGGEMGFIPGSLKVSPFFQDNMQVADRKDLAEHHAWGPREWCFGACVYRINGKLLIERTENSQVRVLSRNCYYNIIYSFNVKYICQKTVQNQ